MKIGCCFGIELDRLKVIQDIGYDFAESNVIGISNMEEDQFASFLREIRSFDIPVEAANCFIPGRDVLVGEDKDYGAISEYVKKALYRSNEIGIKTIIFGSGGARHIPDGMERSEGIKYLVHFLRDIVSPEASKYGIRIAIEPLRAGECNAINTVAQAVEISDMTGCDNIKVLGDVFHMLKMNETPDELLKFKGKIIHTHTSYPRERDDGITNNRRYPKKGDDYSQYPFMKASYEAGSERMSLEAGSPREVFDAEAAESYEVFRDTYKLIISENK
ncbi:MAG: sugar phosphate isomerase/epimerase [Clostridiales bacterium]|nr:sugar phosphate isomerase/epimerase [Clostridiales bacterium]